MNDSRQQTRQVVCGVGATGSPAAVDLSAREAVRRRADLHLVHVIAYPAVSYAGAETEQPGVAEARHVLTAARATVAAAYPGLTVTDSTVEEGWVADGLTEASAGAALLVIEQTSRRHLQRFLSGTTADGVALRTSAPVLVVPHDWSADDAHPGVVTVAVQDVGEAPELVASALRQAEILGAEVHVLHAVWLPGGSEVGGEIHRDWIELCSAELAGVLAGLEALHPDVKTRIDVVAEAPADAITTAAGAATLLVLGRRHRERPWGTHLGPVAHRVLLEAPCPVLLPAMSQTSVTPEPRTPAWSDAETPIGSHDVVVAVGSGDTTSALTFAADEARRRGVAVHVLHATQVVGDGRRLVDAAADVVRGAAPELSVSTHVLGVGQVPATLADRADEAGLLVLQHRRLGAVRRLVTHSVTNGVVSRSRGLVVAVPDGWVLPTTPGRVVVGIADPDAAARALDAGFEEAERRGVPLVVAHSTVRLGTSDGALDRSTIAEWGARARATLLAETRRRKAEHPDVEVATHVVDHSPPIDLISQLVEADDLLVLEARRHFWELPSHLGPVTRGLLGSVACPVLLVPSAPTD